MAQQNHNVQLTGSLQNRSEATERKGANLYSLPCTNTGTNLSGLDRFLLRVCLAYFNSLACSRCAPVL
jgi:hypothetical protein